VVGVDHRIAGLDAEQPPTAGLDLEGEKRPRTDELATRLCNEDRDLLDSGGLNEPPLEPVVGRIVTKD